MPVCFGQPTVATIIKQLDKTPPADKLDLTNNASVQMKPAESMATLVGALRENSSVKTLVLRQCGLNDAAAAEIGELLAQNHVIEELDLEHNNISSSGAIAIANGLIKNQGIRQLNMLHQNGGCFGEVTLERFMEMLGTNITLTKILWRLESRKSFALTKMISRNVEIWRRIGSGRADYVDILPDHLRADPPSVLTDKCAPKKAETENKETAAAQTDDGNTAGEEQADTKTAEDSGPKVAAPEASDTEKAPEAPKEGETATGDATAVAASEPAAAEPAAEEPAAEEPAAETSTEEPQEPPTASDTAPATAEKTPAETEEKLETGEKLETENSGGEPPKDPVESPAQ